MRMYRVEVAVGDYLTGCVNVLADSPEDAEAEAAELIKAQAIDTTAREA
jgi:hypothetical protein